MVNQGLYDFLLMLMTEGLHGYGQLHRGVPVDADELVMIQPDDIALGFCDNGGHIHKLAGTVGQLYGYREDAASLD